MSRSHDPFAPDGNWANTALDRRTPPPDAPPLPTEDGGDTDAGTRRSTRNRRAAAQKERDARKPARGRRTRRSQEKELEEALARLDEASPGDTP